MSRSRRRTLGRWVRGSPVVILALALAALLVRYGFPIALAGFAEGLVGWIWAGAVWMLWPFAAVATWVGPYLRGLPEWVDQVGTLGAGLLPYATLDLVYRRVLRAAKASPMRPIEDEGR